MDEAKPLPDHVPARISPQDLLKWTALVDIAMERQCYSLGGHAGEILAVQLTPDGKGAVTGGADGTIRLWSVAGGKLDRVFPAQGGPVNCLAVGGDGVLAVSGCTDGTVRTWAVSGGSSDQLRGPTTAEEVTAVAMDGSSAVVAAALSAPAILVWRRVGRHWSARLRINAEAYSMSMTADGTRLIAGSFEPAVKLFDTASGEVIRTLEGHEAPVKHVAISADGEMGVTAGVNGEVKAWNLADGTLRRTFDHGTAWVKSLVLSADGARIYTGCNDNNLYIWDVQTGRKQVLPGHNGWVTAVSVSRDGSVLLSGSEDGTVRRWDPTAAKPRSPIGSHSGAIRAVAISSDGALVISAGLPEKGVRLWHGFTGDLLGAEAEVHDGAVTAVAVSGDGRLAASASVDRKVHLWPVANRTSQRTIESHEDWVTALAMSADGRMVVSGSLDGKVHVSGTETGTRLQALETGESSVTAVAVSREGKWVAAGSADGRVRLWEDGGQPLTFQLIAGAPVRSVAMTPDGAKLASAAGTAVHLWLRAAGAAVPAPLEHGKRVTCVALSADGAQVASGTEDGTVRLWNAESGQAVFEEQYPKGHRLAVRSVAFDDTGRFVTASDDGTMRMWSTRVAGHLASTFLAANDPGAWMTETPQGHYIGNGEFVARLARLIRFGGRDAPGFAGLVSPDPAKVEESLRGTAPPSPPPPVEPLAGLGLPPGNGPQKFLPPPAKKDPGAP